MSLSECEKVQLAMMTDSFGEQREVSVDEIESHLAICQSCRSEAAEMQALDQFLQKQTRIEQDVDLWPPIHQQISSESPSVGWQPYAITTLLLVVYKLIEMLSDQPLALIFRLVPILLMVGLFVLIRENPFRIKTELILEK